MKTKNIFISALMWLSLFSACKKDSFETGLSATVKYGKGDCMPPVNVAARTFHNYSGEVYLVELSALNNLGNGDIEVLKQNSLHTNIKNGKLDIALAAGSYVIMPENTPNEGEFIPVIITDGEVLETQVNLWYCTSF